MPVLANAKHDAVALAYIADRERIGWRAYRSVYPKSSEPAARTAWTRLLKKADFSARIAELDAGAAATAQLSAAKVLDEIAKIAFANMQDYMVGGADGQPRLDWSKLTREQAAALQEVTVEQIGTEPGDEEDAPPLPIIKVRFKLASKLGALEQLAKHFGLLKDKVELTGADGGPIKTENVSELELARRIAFALERGAIAAAAAQKKE